MQFRIQGKKKKGAKRLPGKSQVVGTYVALGVVRRTSIGLSGIRRLQIKKKTKYIYRYTTGLVFPLNVVRMKS